MVKDVAFYPPVCTLRVHWEDSNRNGADVYRIRLPVGEWIDRDNGIDLLSDEFQQWIKSPEGCRWRHNVMLYVIHNEGSVEHTIKEVKWLLGRESVEVGGDEEWVYEVGFFLVDRPITMLEDPDNAGDFPFLEYLNYQHPLQWRLPDPGETEHGVIGSDCLWQHPVRKERAEVITQ